MYVDKLRFSVSVCFLLLLLNIIIYEDNEDKYGINVVPTQLRRISLDHGLLHSSFELKIVSTAKLVNQCASELIIYKQVECFIVYLPICPN